jgi:hypothetical protein
LGTGDVAHFTRNTLRRWCSRLAFAQVESSRRVWRHAIKIFAARLFPNENYTATTMKGANERIFKPDPVKTSPVLNKKQFSSMQ